MMSARGLVSQRQIHKASCEDKRCPFLFYHCGKEGGRDLVRGLRPRPPTGTALKERARDPAVDPDVRHPELRPHVSS